MIYNSDILDVGTEIGNLTITGHAGPRKCDNVPRYYVHCSVCNKDFIKSKYWLHKGCKHRVGLKADPTWLPREILRGYKTKAKNRDYSWELTDKQAWDLMQWPCTYCGAEKTNHRKHYGQGKNKGKILFEVFFNGLDRLDNNEGYIIGNVVPCCHWCNRAKRARAIEEWFNWLDEIQANWRGGPKHKLDIEL